MRHKIFAKEERQRQKELEAEERKESRRRAKKDKSLSQPATAATSTNAIMKESIDDKAGGSGSRKAEGESKNRLKVMNDEIERVERVMKRTSSRNSTNHEDRDMNRKASHAESASSGLDPRKALKESKHPITRICLTGGPCAGKTTALATLSVVL